MLLFVLSQNRQQLFFEPGMEHSIGGLLHSFGTQFPGGWTKKGQQFSRSVTHIFMGLEGRFPTQMPVASRLRDRLIGACFILTPHRKPCLLSYVVSPFDQTFFSSVLGSWTVSTPLLRLRCAVPVWHQVRVLPKT